MNRQMSLDSVARLPRQGTAARRVLDLLLEDPWVCGATLAAAVGWAFGARISDLRSAGFEIVLRECRAPSHSHASRVYQYGLQGDR